MNDYILLFSAGILGALHCMGMCGGLIAACGIRFGGGLSFSLSYNAGRILSYSLLGLLMGLLGKALIAAGVFGKFQGIMPVIAGSLMMLIGLDLLGVIPKRLKVITSGLFPKGLSDRLIGKHLGKSQAAPFVLGILNGLIPCGLLYAVGVKAAATADPVRGILTMAAFGAGTLPAMMLASAFSGVAGRSRSGVWLKASYSLIVLLGVRSIAIGVEYMMIHLAL